MSDATIQSPRQNTFRAVALIAVVGLSLAMIAGTRSQAQPVGPAIASSEMIHSTIIPQKAIPEAGVAPQVVSYVIPVVRPNPVTWEMLHAAGQESTKIAAEPLAVTSTAEIAQTKRLRMLRMQVTAYCACSKCCGPNARGLTASGRPVTYNSGAFVAADTSVLPFGTKLQIPGYHGDQPVEVIDRGGSIKGGHIDLFFATHRQALEWGRQWLTVTVVE